ncbi:MAG: RNA polymerase sigma factor [Pirellulaceae bacterium]
MSGERPVGGDEDARIAEMRELLGDPREDRINRLIELAFPFLFARSQQAIFRNYSRRQFVKHTDSIVQVAVIELWKKLRDGRLKVWTVREFLGLANLELTRTAIDVAQREKRLAAVLQQKLEQDGLPPEAASANETDDYLAGLEDSLLLHRSVAALPQDIQEPLRLHYFNGLTVRQVGELLGESPTTVHRRIEEARSILGGIIPNPLEP